MAVDDIDKMFSDPPAEKDDDGGSVSAPAPAKSPDTLRYKAALQKIESSDPNPHPLYDADSFAQGVNGNTDSLLPRDYVPPKPSVKGHSKSRPDAIDAKSRKHKFGAWPGIRMIDTNLTPPRSWQAIWN